jgi:hypothetical protein
MGDEKGIRLKLIGQGVSVDRTVSVEVAQQIVAIALGATSAFSLGAGTQGTAGESKTGGGRPPASVREFMLQQEAKRIPEQIATMALYLKNNRNTAVFSSKDLVKTFEDAQEPVPKNLSRDIGWAVRIGWIAPKVGMKNTYYITSSGEAAVGAKFPSEVRKKTKHMTSGRRTRKHRKVKSANL